MKSQKKTTNKDQKLTPKAFEECATRTGTVEEATALHISEEDSNKMVARKTRKQIHQNFIHLKKVLNLEGFKRKTKIDSVLKKCKSKAFRTIHEALRNCLNIPLDRLPQLFITNIKIEFNKNSLDKTILDIYTENKVITSLEDYREKGYIIPEKTQLFEEFLSMTLRNVFEYYLASRQYVKDYNYIHKREGEGFALLFNYISKVFITYFEKNRGNKDRVKKDKAKTQLPIEGNLDPLMNIISDIGQLDTAL